MLLSAVSVLVVAQSSSEIPEGLMNNSVYPTVYTFSRSLLLRRHVKEFPVPVIVNSFPSAAD